MTLPTQPADDINKVRTRVVALKGGRNLRDLGGYRTEDGRHVRWGLLFRSGTLHGLTTEDRAELRTRGLRALCDLRTTHERDTEPFPVDEFVDLKYWSRDYLTSFAELRKRMADGFMTAEAARQGMIMGYKELPFEQASAYRQLFAYLKAGDVPIIFNCTAGKDRTGTAAALILSALGVPRTTIVEDFVLTNEVVDLHKALISRPGSSLTKRPYEVSAAITRADPAYIASALDSIEERHGGVNNFLHEVLDVNADELQHIRDALLE